MAHIRHYCNYLAIRIFTYPCRWCSYSALHKIGSCLGAVVYFFCEKFRKRTLSNLALADSLSLSPKQIETIAKQSFGNLITTCLEYAKLTYETNIQKIAHCINPEKAADIIATGQGIIFFCGHQANWELLFLEGTSRMPGVAIGRPVQNPYLYRWIISIRQKFGGTMITPKQAVKEGLRALKQGKFLGIVGDQGMPDSGYSCPFLGRKAWTSPLPAILSHRSGSPIIVATTFRKNGSYWIRYSDPIWPSRDRPLEEETDRLMRQCLSLLENSIEEYPSQWLWQHNRWKQQLPGKLKKIFRQDSIAILLPKDSHKLARIVPHLSLLRTLYPSELITLFAPKDLVLSLPTDIEIRRYNEENETMTQDYRFKLIFDFIENPKIRSHFLSQSAFHVVTFKDLILASDLPKDSSFDTILLKALTHAG